MVDDTVTACPGTFTRWSAWGATYPDTVCATACTWPEGQHPGPVLVDADDDFRPNGDIPCPACDPDGFDRWAEPGAAARIMREEANDD